MNARTILLSLFVMLVFSACEEKKQPQIAKVFETLKVESSDILLETEYPATMTGQEIVEVRPQVSGLITNILIQEGQKVHRGQSLFQIDPAPYQAAVDEAMANVEVAEAKLKTAQLNAESRAQLYEQQVIGLFEKSTAENALAEAKAALAQAKAKEASARTSLSYTLVKSPVDGVAGMIPYHVGSLVSSSIAQPLVTVSDDSHMRVYFSISERECTDLIQQYGSMDAFMKQMPSVRLKMSNGDNYEEEGRIDAVSGIAETGTVSVRAKFANPKRLLRNGGSAIVILRTPCSNVIVIPQSATYELQNRVFAYRVEDSCAVTAPLQVNPLNNGTDYVVESGLQVGDEIVAKGAGLVKEGERIK